MVKRAMDNTLKLICCLIILLMLTVGFAAQNPTVVTDKYEQTISQYSITDNKTSMTVHHYHFLNTTKGEVMVDKWTYEKDTMSRWKTITMKRFTIYKI